jgi:membrane protease YdiL (CAAX protease family)
VGRLLAFFFLTYLASWTLFTAAAAISGRLGSPPSAMAPLGTPIHLLGVFAPALVALALTARDDGRAGVRALVGRIAIIPAGARWYVFAIVYMAAIKLTAALLVRLATGSWPPFGSTSPFVMALAIGVSTPVQAGEELGWRAYALPRLASRLGLGPASVVLGVIWACWHLPLFFMTGADTTGQSFPMYLLSVTALSVALAWLYWRTGGSVLLAMLMHAAVNNTKDVVPSAVEGATNVFALNASPVGWATTALLWIAAIFFLVRMRGSGFRPSYS